MEGWTGRIVARILPPNAEGDFEWTQKNPSARIHRSKLTNAIDVTSHHLKAPRRQ